MGAPACQLRQGWGQGGDIRFPPPGHLWNDPGLTVTAGGAGDCGVPGRTGVTEWLGTVPRVATTLDGIYRSFSFPALYSVPYVDSAGAGGGGWMVQGPGRGQRTGAGGWGTAGRDRPRRQCGDRWVCAEGMGWGPQADVGVGDPLESSPRSR